MAYDNKGRLILGKGFVYDVENKLLIKNKKIYAEAKSIREAKIIIKSLEEM